MTTIAGINVALGLQADDYHTGLSRSLGATMAWANGVEASVSSAAATMAGIGDMVGSTLSGVNTGALVATLQRAGAEGAAMGQMIDAGAQQAGSAMDMAGQRAVQMGGMLKQAWSFALGDMLSRGIRGAVSTFQSGIIGANASLETSTAQFETLMKSTDRAREHVAMLFDFAKATPFETQPVINASRMMQTFGGDTLNTKENLTLLGDAVAATGNDFERTGFWVGRLYSAIKGGSPWGAEIMLLQEMNILSGETRQKMEALKESGASGTEIWKAFTDSLQQFNGAMIRQANTWAGLTSTFSDIIALNTADLFRPIFDAAKLTILQVNNLLGQDGISVGIHAMSAQLETGLAEVAGYVGMLGPAIAAGVTAFGPLADQISTTISSAFTVFADAASAAYTWGAGLMSSYGDGILASASWVIDAVMEIANTITEWLMPHSPPKALPDIDQWGTDTMQVYADGMGKANPKPAIDIVANKVTGELGKVGEAAMAIAANWDLAGGMARAITTGVDAVVDAAAQLPYALGPIIDSSMSLWDKTNFDSFNTMAGAFETTIRNLAKTGEIPQQDVVERIVGGRAQIQDLIAQMNQMGGVFEDVIPNITDMLGSAGGQFGDYLRATIAAERAAHGLADAQQNLASAQRATADAQTELTRVTSEYDQRLAPLNDKLKAIQEQQEAVRDVQREAQLQKTLDSGDSSAEDKELARLELQELAIRKQQRAVEKEKDSAVNAAKAKVTAAQDVEDAAKDQVKTAAEAQKAAQDQVELQKQQMSAAQKTNDLLTEQHQLMERLAKQAAGGAKGGGGRGKAGGGGKNPLMEAAENANKAASAIRDNVTKIQASFDAGAAYMRDKSAAIVGALQPIADFVQSNLEPILFGLGTVFVAVVAPIVWAGVSSVLAALWTMISTAAVAAAPFIALGLAAAVLYKAFQENWGGITEIVTRVWQQIRPFFNLLTIALRDIGRDFSVIVKTLYAVWQGGGLESVMIIFGRLLTELADTIAFWGGRLGSELTRVWGVFSSWVTHVGTLLQITIPIWGAAFIAWIAPYIPVVVAALGRMLTTIGGWIVAGATWLGTHLYAWGQGFVTWISPSIPVMLASLGSLLASIGSWIVTNAAWLGTQMLAWGQGFIAWISPYIPVMLAALGDILVSIGSWIATNATWLGDQLYAWGQGFVTWITPYIPTILGALGGILVSIGGWITTNASWLGTQLLTWGAALWAWIQPQIPVLLAQAMSLLGQLGSWLAGQAGTLGGYLATWGAALVTWAQKAIPEFLAAWPGMLSGFLDWIANAVGPILAALGTWLIGFEEWGLGMLAAGIAWITPMLPGLIAGLMQIAAAILVWAGETLLVIGAKLLEWGWAFIQWIAPQIPGLLAALAGLSLSLLDFLATTLVSIIAQLLEWGLAFVSWVVPQIPYLLGYLAGLGIALLLWVATIPGQLVTALLDWGLAFINWVADVVPKIPGALAAIWTGLKDWISGTGPTIASEAKSIGQAVVDGIKAGIDAAWQGCVNFVRGLVDALPAAAKKVLGIASPSKVFAAIGRWIPPGLTLGMQQSMPAMLSAVTGMADSAINAASDTIATAQVPGIADAAHDVGSRQAGAPTTPTTSQDATLASINDRLGQLIGVTGSGLRDVQQTVHRNRPTLAGGFS